MANKVRQTKVTINKIQLIIIIIFFSYKLVFQNGFPFVLTLGVLHFIATYLVLLFMSKCLKMFETKYLSFSQNVLVGGMGIASISTMNYSLRFNSVGVYQMAKLCIIPCVLLFQAMKQEYQSRKVILSIVFILGGVGIATVSDVELNTIGLLFALSAIISTAQYQIWQGSKQKEAGLSEFQMSMTMAWSQIWLGGILAAIFEGEDVYRFITAFINGSSTNKMNNNTEGTSLKQGELVGLILITCALAVSANVHSFALIGKTSAITWQVVGHGKTCLIIIAGYVLYPLPSLESFIVNASGISVAVLGVIVYSNLKMHEKDLQPDWCDLYAPAMLLNFLKKSVIVSSEKNVYQPVSTKEDVEEQKKSVAVVSFLDVVVVVEVIN